MSVTSPATLTVYLNEDVAMNRPYRLTLPASVDTLAELCEFLTAHLPSTEVSSPSTAGGAGVGGGGRRGFRFLYTPTGKPLWRVRECVEAGRIVVSGGPGFLARKAGAPSTAPMATGTTVSSTSTSTQQPTGRAPRPIAVEMPRGAPSARETLPPHSATNVTSSSTNATTNGSDGGASARGRRAAVEEEGFSPPVRPPPVTARAWLGADAAYPSPQTWQAPYTESGATARYEEEEEPPATARYAPPRPPPPPQTEGTAASESRPRLSIQNESPTPARRTRLWDHEQDAYEEGTATSTADAFEPSEEARREKMTTFASHPTAPLPSLDATSRVANSGVQPVRQVQPFASRQQQQEQHEEEEQQRVAAAGLPFTTRSTTAAAAPPSTSQPVFAASRKGYEYPQYTRPTVSSADPVVNEGRGSRLVTGTSPRSVVVQGGRRWVLPPPPQYGPPPLTEAILESDGGYIAKLKSLLSRKLPAFERLRLCAPTELIAVEDVVSLYKAAAQRYRTSRDLDHYTVGEGRRARASGAAGGSTTDCPPIRLCVDGPILSGVSTTTALLAQAAVEDDFVRGGALRDTLLLPIDLSLFAHDLTRIPRHTAGGSGEAVASVPVLTDVTSLFQIVVRAVMDAVAVQRPALREGALLIAELWDKLVKVRADAPPDFTVFGSVAALVGHKVLGQWNRFARVAFPILREACASSSSPSPSSARDAALDVIFYGLPGEIASALRFTGIVYVLDGLDVVSPIAPDRLHRPHGDVGGILKPIFEDTNCHVLCAWPSTVPVGSLFLPRNECITRVRTLGLVSADDVTRLRLPRAILCEGKRFSSDLFLGAPGYLSVLMELTRTLPVRGPPTTSFSSFFTRKKQQEESEPFTVQVDAAEVRRALDQLELLGATSQ